VTVQFRAATSGSGGTSTNVVLNRPAGVVEGDLLVAVLGSDRDGTLAAMTAPAGWTERGAHTQTSCGFVKVWTKIAGASEPTSYTFPDSTSADAVGGMLAFHSYDPSAPLAVAPVFASSATAATAHPAPSVTGVDGGMLVTAHFGGANANATRSYTPPSGMTERVDVGPSSWTVLGVNTQSLTAAGATGTKTATCSASVPYITTTLVVKPGTVNVTDSATVTDSRAVSDVRAPLVDTIEASEHVAVRDDELDFADLNDTATAADAAAPYDANILTYTDPAASGDAATVTEPIPRVDTATAADSRTVADVPNVLTDTFTAVDETGVLDVPYTAALPLHVGPVYDLAVVLRIAQPVGPPMFVEVDSIRWESLSYTTTLSRPQDLAATCLVASQPGEVLQLLKPPTDAPLELWLTRDGKMVFAGPLYTYEVSGDKLTLNARGLLSYLRRMRIRADRTFTQVDQFTMVQTMVDQWQAAEYGHFGIDTTAVGASGVLRDGTYLRDELHDVGQRVEELGARINGFDLEVDPSTRRLQLWYPVKGVDRSKGEDAVVFDAQSLASADVSYSVSPDDWASEVFATGTGTEQTLFVSLVNTELLSRIGRSAVSGTFDGVSRPETLTAHAQAMLDARAEALVVPGPTARITADTDLDSYSVGDTVWFEAPGPLGVEGAFRLRAQTVNVTKAGQETITIEFV
jgi:hypothetical protein